MSQLSIPSPSIEAFHLGPLTIHIYALCILAGIVVAYISGGRRYQARGGKQEQFEELCALAVIAGIIGGRLYHVITDHQLYFGPGRTWYHCFFIWQGGLGIWGAISLGGLAIWLYCRRKGIRFASVADSLAPGILAAQAIGRLGNWFNQELFGRPTSLPWGLEIDLSHRPAGYLQYATFHPTFLYELVWSWLVLSFYCGSIGVGRSITVVCSRCTWRSTLLVVFGWSGCASIRPITWDNGGSMTLPLSSFLRVRSSY